MKTRIKVIEKQDGSTWYICQKKSCFIDEWRELYLSTLSHAPEYRNTFRNLEEAKAMIDLFWKEMKEYEQREQNNKIKSTTYIKYP